MDSLSSTSVFLYKLFERAANILCFKHRRCRCRRCQAITEILIQDYILHSRASDLGKKV